MLLLELDRGLLALKLNTPALVLLFQLPPRYTYNRPVPHNFISERISYIRRGFARFHQAGAPNTRI